MPVIRNPQFYFKEGFCWTNVLNPNSRLLKAKLKQKSINDVGSMSLYSVTTKAPNYYLVCLLNSNIIFDYYREFLNCTVNIQINDIRQIPVVIPSDKQLNDLSILFNRIIKIKQEQFKGKITNNTLLSIEDIEKQIESIILEIYAI